MSDLKYKLKNNYLIKGLANYPRISDIFDNDVNITNTQNVDKSEILKNEIDTTNEIANFLEDSKIHKNLQEIASKYKSLEIKNDELAEKNDELEKKNYNLYSIINKSIADLDNKYKKLEVKNNQIELNTNNSYIEFKNKYGELESKTNEMNSKLTENIKNILYQKIKIEEYGSDIQNMKNELTELKKHNNELINKNEELSNLISEIRSFLYCVKGSNKIGGECTLGGPKIHVITVKSTSLFAYPEIQIPFNMNIGEILKIESQLKCEDSLWFVMNYDKQLIEIRRYNNAYYLPHEMFNYAMDKGIDYYFGTIISMLEIPRTYDVILNNKNLDVNKYRKIYINAEMSKNNTIQIVDSINKKTYTINKYSLLFE